MLAKIKNALSDGTHPDLLNLYIRNHSTNIFYHVFVFISFVIAKIYLYGSFINMIETGLYALFFCVSAFSFVQLRKNYSLFLSPKYNLEKNQVHVVLDIMVLRLLYLLPWMLFLFFPLESDVFYKHLLGYCFIFCAISVYASVSSSYYPLLIFDIGLLLIFSTGVSIINLDVIESLYAQIFVSIFALSSVFVTMKNNKAAKQFVKNENALKAAALEAKEHSQAKADFLAVMSHEVRTPMTGIAGMVDFLKETDLNEEQSKYIETITQCSQTLMNTLNDVLDISKMEAGQLAISPINFDFIGLLKGVEKTFENIAKQKSIYFRVNIADNVPQNIYADPNRIQQVILNLSNNAIKFTESGGVTINVTYDENIKVAIEDTGIGISEDHQAMLFKKFSQVDGSISRKYGGTGLGLFIAQNLIASMDGIIGFHSTENSGSTFWFEIPYVPINEMADNKLDVLSSQNFTPLTILLVDDNELNRKIISKYLMKYHSVVTAENGRDAISIIQEKPFDVVLMDLQMPDINGFETTQRIKALNLPCSNIPVIAMSANVLEKDIEKCKSIGMVDHIGKPINQTQMFQTIEKYAGAMNHQNMVPDNSNAAPHGNSVIRTMVEELGPDYVSQFIKDSRAEIVSNMKDLNLKIVKGNHIKAAPIAHNLISLFGNIGLLNAAERALEIEKSCNNNDLATAKAQYSIMRKEMKSALEALEQSLK